MIAALTVLLSYLIGAIPFGYLIARWRGVDILHQGSGNIGATNIGRVLGWRFGILVFLLDFAKGAVPAALATSFATRSDDFLAPESLGVAAGLSAFLGHLFPIYLRFRGGKGVATGTGVVSVLLPGPALGALLIWLTVVSAFRYVSLASLCAAVALCGFRMAWTPEPFAPENRILTLFCLVAAILVWVRHGSNIKRLLRGTENRPRDTAAMLSLSKVIHVLALGLWFGSGIFFSFVAAPVIFQTFQSPGTTAAADRDAWLALLKNFDEQTEKTGTRLAGAAVGPIFPWYFLIQGVCGLLAVITALAWSWAEPQSTLHRVRSILLLVALATVVAGWPLAQKVSALRAARYAADAAVAESARAAFGSWHAYSLLLNMFTLLLVTAAMTLAAWLPTAPQQIPADRAAAPAPEPQTAAAQLTE